MSMQTFAFIASGTALMFAIMLLIRTHYNEPVFRCIILSILLTISGVASVKLLFFIENGDFSGLSFFGAVLFVPVFLFAFSKLIRIGYSDYLDISAPCISAMLAVMKINCILYDCCRGRVVRINEKGIEVRFPSQTVELVAAAVIAIVLVYVIKKDRNRHMVYPIFMIMYSASRFVLNLFREADPFFLGLPVGNMWAAAAALTGIIWLIIAKLRQNDAKTAKSI